MYERKRRPPAQKKPEADRSSIPARSEEEAIKVAGGYAMDLAMEWLKDGSAPAQIVSHFLKANSPKEQAELRKINKEIELLEAKKQAIISAEEQEKKYQEVIKAISAYAGRDNEWEVVEDDYE